MPRQYDNPPEPPSKREAEAAIAEARRVAAAEDDDVGSGDDGSAVPEPPLPQTPDLRKSLEDLKASRDYGLDPDSLTIYDGERRWHLRPECSGRAVKYAVAAAQDELTAANAALTKKEEETGVSQHLARLRINDAAAKKILDAAVQGLDYDARMAEGGDPHTYQLLAADIARFLVADGGRAGHQHLQMLQKAATLIPSGTTRDSGTR